MSVIRPARPPDFDKLYALAESVLELRVSARHAFMDPEEFRMSMASPDSVFLVAERDDNIAGFIYADSNDPEKRGAEKKWACLVYLAVAEQHRRQGVATALYEDCIAELKRRGVTHVYGWAGLTHPIAAFLQTHGFEAGRACIWMDRAL